MRDAAEHVALFKLGEVEAGAEMIAVAGQHDGANFGRQIAEERHDALHQRVVQRITLLGPMAAAGSRPGRASRRESEDGSLMALKSEPTVDC